jgi:hypothetical protein
MKPALILAQVLSAISICWAQSPKPQARLEAEYYVVAYAFGSELRQQRFTAADFAPNKAEHTFALRKLQHSFWRNLESV